MTGSSIFIDEGNLPINDMDCGSHGRLTMQSPESQGRHWEDNGKEWQTDTPVYPSATCHT